MKVVNSGGGDGATEQGNADRKSEAATIESETQEMIRLLKAILLGIEIIADQENLINNIEE